VRADLRRRSVLAAAVMTVPLVAAGCKGVGALGTPPEPGPDVAVLRGAIGTEQALIARYRSAMAGSPALSGTLGPLLAQHREHLARLTSMLIEPAGHGASPDTTPSAAGTAAMGSGPAATLAALEAAEAGAARSLDSRLILAPPALAQLMASIAASEASHALLLRTHQAGG
jgi:hypothetical protein